MPRLAHQRETNEILFLGTYSNAGIVAFVGSEYNIFQDYGNNLYRQKVRVVPKLRRQLDTWKLAIESLDIEGEGLLTEVDVNIGMVAMGFDTDPRKQLSTTSSVDVCITYARDQAPFL
jgi:hypothetical protein